MWLELKVYALHPAQLYFALAFEKFGPLRPAAQLELLQQQAQSLCHHARETDRLRCSLSLSLSSSSLSPSDGYPLNSSL